VIRVTKNSGERIIQGMGVLNKEKTEFLIRNIFGELI